MSTIAQIESTRVVVGVDTHRDSHTAVALDEIGRKLDQITVDTDTSGYQQLVNWSAGLGQVVAFGVEGAGCYGAGVASHLRENGVQVIEIDRPNRKARRFKGKAISWTPSRPPGRSWPASPPPSPRAEMLQPRCCARSRLPATAR